jgi:peptide/nickel transport system ATP-binding protein/oligopeptide transport system ATP-binding protein
MYLGRIVELATTDQLFGQAAHPYTEALLSSTPTPDPDAKSDRIILSGGVPSPRNPPSGCHFHPRCAAAADYCSQAQPALVDAGGGHLVACFLATRGG